MRKAKQRPQARFGRGGRRGERRLIFERLDVRAVLSTATPLPMAPPWGDPRVDVSMSHETLHGHLLADSAAERGAGDALRGFAGAPWGGPSQADALRAAPDHGPSAPAVVVVPAGVIFDALGFGFGSQVLLVTIGTGNGPGGRGPGANPLALYFQGTTSALSPQPPLGMPAVAASVGAGSQAPGRGAGNTSGIAPALGSVSNGISAAEAAALARTGSSTSLQSVSDARGSLFVVPNGSSLWPAFEFRREGTEAGPERTPSDQSSRRPQFDGEGGLIELDRSPSTARAQSPPEKLDEEPLGQRRKRRAENPASQDDLWNELLDALALPGDESQDRESTDRATDAHDRQRKPLADDAAPDADAVATFDEGGMIELEAGVVATGMVAPALAEVQQPMDAVHVTIEAGVAMFQAFELSTEPAAAQPAPVAVPQGESAPARGGVESIEASVGEGEDTTHRAAGGVGLGVLAALPFVRRRKQSDDEADDEAADVASKRTSPDEPR